MRDNVLAAILSGGAGQRLNGMDKGLYPYQSKPLIEHVIKSLSPQVNNTIICANRNIDKYQQFGFKVVRDRDQTNYQGPIAGILAALNFITASNGMDHISALVIAPCDAPKLPANFVSRLLVTQATLAVAHDGHRSQNLHCLIARQHWGSLQKFYADGGRALHRWFSQHDAVCVDFSDEARSFVNMNSEGDMR